MKKLLSLVVVGVLVLGMLYAPAVVGEEKSLNTNPEKSPTPTYVDELDQQQPDQTDGLGIPVGRFPIPEVNLSIQAAQSFIPTKAVLTRVELYAGRNSTTTYPCVVAIRDDLTEENIVEVSLDPSEFVVENYSWVEFDFEDIWVEVGETYYIVCYTENETDNFYAWAANNDSESYPNGCAWFSTDEGDTWSNDSLAASQDLEQKSTNPARPTLLDGNVTWDMCFKTYGIEETELEIEMTNGIGLSFIIRNIGNETAYELEWSINVTGGIFGLVNISVTGSLPELLVGEEIIASSGVFLGLGPIKITVSAWALNAQKVTGSTDAILVIFFILIR